MTLTQKISFSIFFTAILTAGVVGMFVFTTTKSALQKEIGGNQLGVTRQTMDKIDRLLYERYLDIAAIAANDSLESFLTRGELIAEKDLEREFHENTILTGPWDLLYAVDKNGIVVVSTDKEEVGKFVAEYTQRKIAIEQASQGRVYYSDLVISDNTSKPTIIFAAPVRSRELGRPVIGVVLGNFSWAVVLEILEELTEKARLYNGQGLLIGSSNPDESNDDLLRDDHLDSVVQSALKEREKSGIFPSSKKSISVLASYVRQLGYLNYKGNEWRFIIETPTEIAFAPALKEARDLAVVSVVISIFSALVIFVIINRNVVRPVILLTQTAGIIAKGGLTRRAQILSKDEIGKLAKSFNEMTDSLVDAFKLPESIIHSIGDGLIVLDEEGKIELMNPQAEKIFTVEKSSVVGKKIGELKSQHLFASLIELLGEKPETVFRKEFYIDDNMIMEVTVVGVEFGEERERFMIVLHDITREKRVERLKTEFVSIAAHQLRTPLSAVKWATSLLLEDMPKRLEKYKVLVEKAYQSNERMIVLVGDLLNVARIEEGRYLYNPIRTSIHALITSVVESFLRESRKKGIQLFFEEPEEKLPEVFIDVEAIKVVLENLFWNAIQYTPEGTVKIRSVRDEGQVNISVHDTGIGIPKDQQGRIFTKFFRGKNAVILKPDGSGLGLFIASNIVKMHGGQMWFESEEGKGTTFHFTIPVAA